MAKVLLTPHFVKHKLVCPEGKSRFEYCDTAHPGLYAESRPNCDWGTYYLRYKDSTGKTCHQKIGRTYELTLAETRKRAAKLKAEILLGANPAADKRAQKSVMTLEEFSNEHYLPYAEKRKRSYRNDVGMLNRILPIFGATPLNRLSKQSLVAFHSSLRDEGLAAATADHHIKLLRAMLNLAVQWDLVDKNPADRIKLFREDNTLERYLSVDEQSRLLDAIAQEKNQVIANLILLLLASGARRSEAQFSHIEHFDIDNRVWKIPATNSKSKKVRSVPLNDLAIKAIESVPRVEGSPYMFTNPRTKTCYDNIARGWTRIKEAAGLPKEFRLHDLRHSFASRLVNKGRSLYEVQALLGHSDPTVTQRYAHLSSKALQDAANAASDALDQTPAKSAQS